MAQRRNPLPVIPIVAVISRHAVARQWGIKQLCERFPKIAFCSDPQPFEASGYYSQAMGENLEKQFVGFDQPADPGELADWKVWTNSLEAHYAAGHEHPETRPLNLDCGYITEAKLVLATTKDRDHRIYLTEGIYAEVTLSYTGRRWTHHRWSYPDYRTPLAIEFAEQCRLLLRQHIAQRRLADEL